MRLVNLLGTKRNQKETKHVNTNSTTERKVKIFARMFLKSNCFTSCSKSRAGAESDRLLYKVLYFVFLHHRLCHISEIHDLMYFAILLYSFSQVSFIIYFRCRSTQSCSGVTWGNNE